MKGGLVWVAAAVLGGYAAVSLVVGARHALAPGQSQDLAPVYMAARLWLEGDNPYREPTLNDWRAAGVSDEDVPTDRIERAYSTPYAPMALLVVSGIATLPWETARACWLAINLALAVYIAALLHNLWFRSMRAPWAVVLLAVWFGGIGLRVGLGNGQHTLVWFAAMLTMYALMLRQHSWGAGALLALSLHKYPLTAFVVPFLAAHRWFRLLAGSALAAGAAILLFTLTLGVSAREVLDSFVRESAWWFGQTGARSLSAQGITDVRPVLAALLPDGAPALVMWAVILVGLAAVCWPVERSRPCPAAIDLAALFLLMLVATYHRVYDTIILILPLWILARSWTSAAEKDRWVARVLTLLLALVWYVDPSAIYRRMAPMALDVPPDTRAFLALDWAYRLIIAAGFVLIVVRRLQTPIPARTVVPDGAWS